MKRLLIVLAAWLSLAGTARAADAAIAWDRFPVERITNLAALQNGARLFVNYCLNCHSAQYMRYNRMREIGLSEDQIREHLVFTSQKVGETMRVAIDPLQAKDWFGNTPPDLSVIARSRSAIGQGSGADYLYTFLRSFYRDDTKETGWNNLAFPNVGMPHVLWELQGQRSARFAEVPDPHAAGKTVQRWVGYEQIAPGTLPAHEYDLAVADLVAFLAWMAEPTQRDRVRLGVWVLLFLALCVVIAWRLNAAYWKDVH